MVHYLVANLSLCRTFGNATELALLLATEFARFQCIDIKICDFQLVLDFKQGDMI